MKIREDKLVHRYITSDIKCDVCGKSCKKTENRFFDYSETEYEFATIDADWGYYSDSDGKSYNIDLCENCFYDTLAHLKLRCKTDVSNLSPTNRL